MSDNGDNTKYKWTPESTALLVSVWSDRQVQKQLEYASKPQLIWESVGRYMKKKGYNVSGKQCRSRMKQVLVCYREAKRAGTRAGVEQYYESIDRVLKSKRLEENDFNGIDTVDAAIHVKSPPKEVKTNKNLQMRYSYQEPVATLRNTCPLSPRWSRAREKNYKYQDPVPSLCSTRALSPPWVRERDVEYPDSPESNETIIARPNGVLSPTRDVAINTGEQLAQIAGKSVHFNFVPMEEPVRVNYKQNILPNSYGEVPFQNTVQNVQNQIIQENMQQNQNCQQNHMCNQQNTLENNFGFQNNVCNIPQGQTMQTTNIPIHANVVSVQNPNLENIMQQQHYVQPKQYSNNCAVPQEPQKVRFRKNLTYPYKEQREAFTAMPVLMNVKPTRSQFLNDALYYSSKRERNPILNDDFSESKSGEKTDIFNDGFCESSKSDENTQVLNYAFCESLKNDEKIQSLNEIFNQPTEQLNPSMMPTADISVITNNATCNDDSLLLEFLINSPTPSETDNKSRDTAVNTDTIPNVPLRKKKAQKLEQLVLSAINSQNEVVNKILAAQNDMVSKFLDVDRDRQNRLENRLDNLLEVVHASVLNKQISEGEDKGHSPLPEPPITSLAPPPKPGVVPPKLDLVPPKPCRVPCTIPNSNIELINQNPILTKPGFVSPVTSPARKPGTIWSKLGPVSQSPFVKAQQRLGLQPILTAETRTQSSVERRIAKEVENFSMDTRTLIFETNKLLEMERQLEENVENARRQLTMSQTLNARRKLFTQREPTPAMILTAAFLENECRISKQDMERYQGFYTDKRCLREIQDDELLGGQGESYERLRQLNVPTNYLPDQPCNSSTPAKLTMNNNNNEKTSTDVPKQTIQQLAQILMNTGRWKDVATHNQKRLVHSIPPNFERNQNVCPGGSSEAFIASQSNTASHPLIRNEIMDKVDQNHIQTWLMSNYGNSANEEKVVHRNAGNATIPPKPKYPIGFTTEMLDSGNPTKREVNNDGVYKSIGFKPNVLPDRKQQSVRFMDEALAELQRMYIDKVAAEREERNDSLPYVIDKGNPISPQSRQMIERYIHDTMPRKQFRDKDKDTDSDNDEEFLDSTATMTTSVVPRVESLPSTATASTDFANLMKFGKSDNNCVIS